MKQKTVCIQGLGFVGAAMAVAVANAKSEDGTPIYKVVGVDLDSPEATRRIDSINNGEFPFPSVDREMEAALKRAHKQGNLRATCDPEVYKEASVVVVDVHLDVDFSQATPQVNWDGFKAAITTAAKRMPENSLLMLETTVPPGTTEKVVQPIVMECCKERGLADGAIQIAHSYERVMPGPTYYKSIVEFWRVYSGLTSIAKDKCREFLTSVIDTENFPLTELERPAFTELAKILENSYRATNIAFIQEWTEFADSIGVNLFDVLGAITVRPTHNNIRFPGFGVGGYCLTKDPAFPSISAQNLYEQPNTKFPFCEMAMSTNNNMPLYTFKKLKEVIGSSLQDKRILLAGVSYRSDVGDTRYSPAEIFVRKSEDEGATFVFHDPFVSHWSELDRAVEQELPSSSKFDAVVFSVNHPEYLTIGFKDWLGDNRPAIVDAHNVLSRAQHDLILELGLAYYFVGHGKSSLEGAGS